MSETIDSATWTLLDAYVRSRNATRSAIRAADGFVSGKRVFAARMAQQDEQRALSALGAWVEAQARAALGRQSGSQRRGAKTAVRAIVAPPQPARRGAAAVAPET